MNRLLIEAASDRRQLLRSGLLATLPATVLVISPERPTLSFMLAPLWLAAAALLSRRNGRDRAPLLYAAMAAAFMGAAALGSYLDGSLTAAQRSYGLFKAEYFVAVALPLGMGVALIIDRAEDFKPSAVSFIVVGTLLALPTILLRDTAILGQGRYTWQGVLIALAALILLQFWVLRSVAIASALAVLCIVGVGLTLSRQALLAAMIAIVCTTAYWLMAQRRSQAPGPLRWRWLVPLCILTGLGTAMASLVLASTLLAWRMGPSAWLPDVSGCNCSLARYRELFFLQAQDFYGGDNSRVRLLETGWHVFLANPLGGAGLGSLDGLVPEFRNNPLITYHYPHDIWLELGAEVGLVGLMVVVAPLVFGFVQLWRQGTEGQSQAIGALLVTVCIFAVVVSFSGDLAAARTLWVFALPCLKLGVTRSADAAAEPNGTQVPDVSITAYDAMTQASSDDQQLPDSVRSATLSARLFVILRKLRGSCRSA